MRRRSMTPRRLLGRLETRDVLARFAGWVVAIDTEALGLAAVVLGAGRLRADAAIDPGVGFTVLRTRRRRGEPRRAPAAHPSPPWHRPAARSRNEFSAPTASAVSPCHGRRSSSSGWRRQAERICSPQLDEAAAAVRGQAPGIRRRRGAGAGQRALRRGAPPRIPAGAAPRRRSPTSAPPPSPDTLDGWCWARVGRLRLAVLAGRLHPYEGWSAAETVFPVRLLLHLGAPVLVLTNAAGRRAEPTSDGATGWWSRDHLNLSGLNPLRGPNDVRLGPRFPDLSRAYDPELRALLAGAAVEAGHRARRGRLRDDEPGPRTRRRRRSRCSARSARTRWE